MWHFAKKNPFFKSRSPSLLPLFKAQTLDLSHPLLLSPLSLSSLPLLSCLNQTPYHPNHHPSLSLFLSLSIPRFRSRSLYNHLIFSDWILNFPNHPSPKISWIYGSRPDFLLDSSLLWSSLFKCLLPPSSSSSPSSSHCGPSPSSILTPLGLPQVTASPKIDLSGQSSWFI